MSQVMTNEVFARLYVQAGVGHFRENRFREALAFFDAALRYNPDDDYARYNRASVLLSMGDYARGFPEHDVAWRLFQWRGFGPVREDIDKLSVLPVWRGEHHVSVLVYHELGFGDAIMVMRYLPELKRRAEVTLLVDPCLARLARGFDVEVVEKVPNDLREYDYRLPFFGVMSALGETVETIPAEPYIRVPLPVRDDRRNLGIAWSGRTQTMFTAERFLSLLQHEGFRIHALQPGPAPDGIEPLRPGSDFADVADRMAAMDHIVTVDTAAAHLAGAIGHSSVHLLLPFMSDWRWWHASAWYPRITTYRQPQPGDDWRTPFAQINATLKEPATKGEIDG